MQLVLCVHKVMNYKIPKHRFGSINRGIKINIEYVIILSLLRGSNLKKFIINALFVAGLFLYYYFIDFDITRLSYWILLYPVIWFSVLLYIDTKRKNRNKNM